MKYKLINTLKATFPCVLTKEFTILKTQKKTDNESSSILYINGSRFKESIKFKKPNFNEAGLLFHKLYYIEGIGYSYEIDLKTGEHKVFLEDENIGFRGFVDDKIIIENVTDCVKSNFQTKENDFMALIDSKSHEIIWTTKKLFNGNFFRLTLL
jgi:hypothetical protein